MTDLSNIQSVYEDANKQEQLGNHKDAKNTYSEVIDGCKALLSGKIPAAKKDDEKVTGEETTATTTTAAGSESEIYSFLALAYNNRGYLRYLQVDFDEAVEDYTEALKYDSTLTVAYYNRGLIHYRLGRFAAAIKDQTEALRGRPDFQSARTCLEEAEAQMHKNNNA